MNTLERSEWLVYQQIVPQYFSKHHQRILAILDASETEDQYKNITLNDLLRNTWIWWNIVITQGINLLQASVKNRVIEAVKSFDTFNEDNDPYGEHDFWSISLGNENYCFKVDYFSKEPGKESEYMYGAETPSDPSTTSRVLTIMHQQEY